jgi:hypothetical protein
MTKPELQQLLETLADTLDLIAEHFPAELADQVIQMLGSLPAGADVQTLARIVANVREVFTTSQAAELANFLRDLEERRFLLKMLLKRINKANR